VRSGLLPALDIGGSHVTAALVDLRCGAVRGPRFRRSLERNDSAENLLVAMADAADQLDADPGSTWGVSMPGPFDYPAGIALYENVGKFESLYGMDMGVEIGRRMRSTPKAIRFLNDASSFALGEWRFGASRGHAQTLSLTLGTGVGSCFLSRGSVISTGPTVPIGGRADLMEIDGRPLEDTVSTRSMQRDYLAVSGEKASGVDVIAARAIAGDPVAAASILGPMTALGAAFAPWLQRFEATVLVIGGSVTGSWSLIEPAIRAGIASFEGGLSDRLLLVRSADTEASALAGAATSALL
jgi:glucokinase